MPGDAQHNKVGTIVCLLLTLPMIFFDVGLALILVFVIAFTFSTRFLSPDIDTNSKPYQRWGPLRALMYLYMKTFKHRGMSHSLLLGPLSMILYLMLIVIPLMYLFVFLLLYAMRYIALMAVPFLDAAILYMQSPSNLMIEPMIVVIVVAAVFASRWTHSLHDIVVSGERR